MNMILPGDPDLSTLISIMLRVDHAGEYGAKRIYLGQLNCLKFFKYSRIFSNQYDKFIPKLILHKICQKIELNEQRTQDVIELIEHMYSQELQHLQYFDDMIINTKTRPTLLQPIWHIAGYALGFTSALFGTKAMMVCTIAVETVIDTHYLSQIKQLTAMKLLLDNDLNKDIINSNKDCNQNSKHIERIPKLLNKAANADNMKILLAIFLNDLLSKITQFRLEEIEHMNIATHHNQKLRTSNICQNFFMSSIKFVTKTAIFLSKKL